MHPVPDDVIHCDQHCRLIIWLLKQVHQSTNVSFCLNNSPKPKDVQFTNRKDNEKLEKSYLINQQINDHVDKSPN